SITELSKWLHNHSDLRANDLGKRLYPYTEKGMYGRYFNGKANISFENPFLVMELEELKNKGDMQSIVLMLIIFQITNTIYAGNRETKNACIIDEAWQLLNGEKIKVFIEKMARTARKYNASIITGTQSIQDYFENSAAQAVYNNSDYTIIMMQKEGVIEKLV
ncbi:MAG TPA: ATP-binding protein, partial [Candidatus Berkiella sp.]|nr:ATP-binding protein [Candidatus Berkiella sp.]